MSEQRLIDAEELKDAIEYDFEDNFCYTKELFRCIDCQPTIDPETLPIVQELREKLSRYEQAAQEGRLIELPCKIGDHIYVIPSQVNYDLNKINYPADNRVYEQEVAGYREYNGQRIFIETFGRIYSPENFGETWFLTREEAEAALKEMESDGI